MPIAAQALISRANDILNDDMNARWTQPELLRWVNDAARETIIRRPAARSVIKPVTLAAGALQSLPERGVEVLDVIRNMGTNGTTPGRIVRRVDRRLLDDINPDWHSLKAATVIKHFTFDERAPKAFYCYPPAVAGVQLEVMYSELPPEITDLTQNIDMGSEYINVLVSYMVFRALSKDSEFSDGTIAAAHYQAFVDAVTDNNQQTTANSPNANHK